MKTTIKQILITGILLIASAVTTAQVLRIVPKNSSITINGTSNLHDWTSKSEQVKGELVLSAPNQVQSLSLEIPVKSIKSKEKLMDSKTYDAFNADKNPNIYFKLTDLSNLQIIGNDVNVNFNGNLTMAGATRKVTIKATGKNNGNGTYIFNGNVSLKMTDFKMSPPTALLGAIKVGDAVKLAFNITLQEQTQASNN
jgi:polyisoprenoid-binding protein YceI